MKNEKEINLVKETKNLIIKSQLYGHAAILRDVERMLMEEDLSEDALGLVRRVVKSILSSAQSTLKDEELMKSALSVIDGDDSEEAIEVRGKLRDRLGMSDRLDELREKVDKLKNMPKK